MLRSKFEGLKERVESVYKKEYPSTENLEEDSKFQEFVNVFLEAQEKLQDDYFTGQDKLTKYYSYILGRMTKTRLDSRVHFQTIRSVRSTEKIKLIETPRIFFIIPDEDEVKKEISTDELIQCVAPYACLGKPGPNFLGVYLTLEKGKTFWIRNFNPQESISSEHLSMFDLKWSAESLNNFWKSVISGKKVDSTTLRNFYEFYVFHDCLRLVYADDE